MSLEALLKSFIYVVSTALFIPSLVLLSLIFLWLLYRLGVFFSEWLQRRRRPVIKDEQWREAPFSPELYASLTQPVYTYQERLKSLQETNGVLLEAEVEILLQQSIQQLWAGLDRLKMVIRMGPGLGLIGTLIPMGTGLAALGQGDITKLSADLVIAFTTTVLGLAEGMGAYFLYLARRRWVEVDIRAMEFITEMSIPPEKE